MGIRSTATWTIATQTTVT